MTQSTILSLVGQRGGGKNLYCVYLAYLWSIVYPWVTIYSNFPINLPRVKLLPTKEQPFLDIVAHLAYSTYVRNMQGEMYFIDEAGTAGYEARGSGSRESGIDTYPVMHSRKVNKNIILITQFTSQLDPRIRNISDGHALCEAKYETDESYQNQDPDYFKYTFYDEYMSERPLASYEINKDLAHFLYRLYNTNYVPNETIYNEMMEEQFGFGQDYQEPDLEANFDQLLKDWSLYIEEKDGKAVWKEETKLYEKKQKIERIRKQAEELGVRDRLEL